MAKFYSAAGTRRGRVGNEIYYMHKTQNIVKMKPDFVYNPRTIKQQKQRIQIKNCSLAFRNVKNGLDLNSFADIRPIDSPQNVFYKHNVRFGYFLDRITSQVPNFIFLGQNILCSFGTLDALNSYLGSDMHDMIGLRMKKAPIDQLTVKYITIALLDTYNFLRNADYLTLYSYSSQHIIYDAEQLYRFDNPEKEIKASPIRKCFKLDTNDNTPISEYGLAYIVIDDNTACLTISNDGVTPTDQCKYSYIYPSFILSFYGREVGDQVYNFAPSVMASNKTYNDMCTFINDPEYIEASLESWKVNIPNIYD